MNKSINYDPFDRPVPGESLTRPVGGAKYEQPPQYVTEDDAMFYVLDTVSDKYVAPTIAHALEKGVHASDITNAMLLKGFSEGKFTPDVAALIAKRTMAAVVAAGISQGLNAKDIKFKRPSKKERKLGELLASSPRKEDKNRKGMTEEERIISGERTSGPEFIPEERLDTTGMTPEEAIISGERTRGVPIKGVMGDE